MAAPAHEASSPHYPDHTQVTAAHTVCDEKGPIQSRARAQHSLAASTRHTEAVRQGNTYKLSRQYSTQAY